MRIETDQLRTRLRFCHNSFRESYTGFAVGWLSGNVNTATTPDTGTRRTVNLVPGHVGFGDQLLGLEHDRPYEPTRIGVATLAAQAASKSLNA